MRAGSCCFVRSLRNLKEISRASKNGWPKFFTFNDAWTTKEDAPLPDSVDYIFNEMLPAMYPTPSQFEIASVPIQKVG